MKTLQRNIITLIGFLAVGLLAACGGSDNGSNAASRQVAASGFEANPYGAYQSDVYQGTRSWLCHPELTGLQNVCMGNFDTTVVSGGNAPASIKPYQAALSPEVDCFYVYPTASVDPGENSDRLTDLQEQQTTALQLGLYGSVCRQFAPIYKQRTLTTLALQSFASEALPDNFAANASNVAYADVLDSFKHYIANLSEGRGFILVGHSQGSSMLRRLIAEEIETKPELLNRLIAAHIPGSNVLVPIGQDVGGSFKQVSACRSENQTGCVIAFSAYRKGDPQLANPRYGLSTVAGTQALCVNPAALSGGSSTTEPHIPRVLPPAFQVLLIPRGTGGPYANPVSNLTISTPYYSIPNQLKAECQVGPNGVSYLEIEVLVDEADTRADDYPGEFIGGSNWGLHLPELSLTQGNLVKLAAKQSAAWMAKDQDN